VVLLSAIGMRKNGVTIFSKRASGFGPVFWDIPNVGDTSFVRVYECIGKAAKRLMVFFCETCIKVDVLIMRSSATQHQQQPQHVGLVTINVMPCMWWDLGHTCFPRL
jgi:hypothetical protein